MGLRAITFDFWGTLYQARFDDGTSREPRTAILQRYLMAAGYALPHDQVRAALDDSFRRAGEVWRGEQRTADAPERIGWILAALQAELAPSALTALTAEMEETLLTAAIELVPGAAEVLPFLAKRYRIGLISDTGMTPGRVLRQIMARDGILELFEHCTFSDETGRAKPHPRQFLDTLQRLRAAPAEAAHVGDLVATDIIGARGVGMRSILITGVTQGEDRTLADAVAETFAELPALLTRWEESE
jgi:putative hydrolase of the HAD superfamily